jgi:hypothetical protein
MQRAAVLLAVIVLLLLTLAGQAWGAIPVEGSIEPSRSTAAGSGYDLGWWTVDGGGGVSDNGTGYTLMGTIGQPDAAVWEGDVYTLGGGFWGGMPAGGYCIYLPLVVRGF